jgi:hypothetical protein
VIDFNGILIQRGVFMKFLNAVAVGAASALSSGMLFAQNGNMMNDGGIGGASWMGAYGGYWGPVILAVVVGVVIWVVLQKRK